jgi:hypothetical protein
MHNFQLGDKVYHRTDSVPFEVVGIRKTTVEIQGDFSGGIHGMNQKCWVNHTEIQLCEKIKNMDILDAINLLKSKLEMNAGRLVEPLLKEGKQPKDNEDCHKSFLVLAHLEAIEKYIHNVII